MGDYSAICELRDRAPRGYGCTALTVAPRYCSILHARGRCQTVDIDTLVDPAVSAYVGASNQYKVQVTGGGPPPVGYQWINTEAQAWYNAAVAAGAPDTATTLQKSTADVFVGDCKAAGLFALIEQINYPAWHSIAFAMNMKTATAKGAYVGGALFFPDRGVFCDGIDDEFDTQFNPSLATLYLQDSAFHAIFCREDIQQSTAFMSGQVATPLSLVSARNTSDKIVGRVNSSASSTITGTVTTASQFIVNNRVLSSTEEIYADGTNLPCNAAVSTGRQAGTIRLGRSTSTYIRRQASIFIAGGGLTPSQAAALYTAWAKVKTALGITTVYTATTGVPFTNAVTVPQVSQVVVPDGAFATTPGKGYPNTGLDIAPDGSLWGGRGLGTLVATAGIVHLSGPASANDATVTLIQEYQTATLFAGIGYIAGITGAAGTYPATSSTQGLQVAHGGVVGNYNVTWAAIDNVNGFNYYCVGNYNGTVLTAISCSALPNANINAVIPNDIRGGAWCLNTNTGTLYKATIAGGIVSLNGGVQITVSNGGGATDQMSYHAPTDTISVISDPVSGSGNLSVIHPIGDYGRPYARIGDTFILTGARQPEGVVYLPDIARVMSMNDMWTHAESPPNNINASMLNGPITLLSA